MLNAMIFAAADVSFKDLPPFQRFQSYCLLLCWICPLAWFSLSMFNSFDIYFGSRKVEAIISTVLGFFTVFAFAVLCIPGYYVKTVKDALFGIGPLLLFLGCAFRSLGSVYLSSQNCYDAEIWANRGSRLIAIGIIAIILSIILVCAF